MQIAQAGGDLEQAQTAENAPIQPDISTEEVTKVLSELESMLTSSTLNVECKEELLDYLRPAKREAMKENPKKDLIGCNLKRICETLETLKDSSEAGKSLWSNVVDAMKVVSPWLGLGVGLIGL